MSSDSSQAQSNIIRSINDNKNISESKTSNSNLKLDSLELLKAQKSTTSSSSINSIGSYSSFKYPESIQLPLVKITSSVEDEHKVEAIRRHENRKKYNTLNSQANFESFELGSISYNSNIADHQESKKRSIFLFKLSKNSSKGNELQVASPNTRSNLNRILSRKKYNSKSFDEFLNLKVNSSNTPKVSPKIPKSPQIKPKSKKQLDKCFYDPRFNTYPYPGGNYSLSLTSSSTSASPATVSPNDSPAFASSPISNQFFSKFLPQKFLSSKQKSNSIDENRAKSPKPTNKTKSVEYRSIEASNPSPIKETSVQKTKKSSLFKTSASSFSDFVSNLFHTNPAKIKSKEITHPQEFLSSNEYLPFDLDTSDSKKDFDQKLKKKRKLLINLKKSDVNQKPFLTKQEHIDIEDINAHTGYSVNVLNKDLISEPLNTNQLVPDKLILADNKEKMSFETEFRKIEQNSGILTPKMTTSAPRVVCVSNEYSEPFDLIVSKVLKSESVKSARLTDKELNRELKTGHEDDSAYSSCCITHSTDSTPKIIEKKSAKLKSEYNEPEEDTITTFDSSILLSSSSMSSSSPLPKPPRLVSDYESVQDSLVKANHIKSYHTKAEDDDEHSSIGDLFKSTITAFDILSERCSELIDLFDGKTNLLHNSVRVKRKNFNDLKVNYVIKDLLNC